MKIDRLLGITIYLLNHGVVSARVLAEEFEVSIRTILRDMETLSLSGIPITSLYGTGGGYKILDNYKLDSKLMDEEDYSYILTALQGFQSGYNQKGVRDTFEKILHNTSDKEIKQNIFMDLTVCHEGNYMDDYLKCIEKSITDKNCIQFTYTNSNNQTSAKEVEPIALQYKWYAWYLLAYCHMSKNYRWYKLIRMRELVETNIPFSREHEAAEQLIKRIEAEDNQSYITIKLKCKNEVKIPVQEYLRGVILEENDNFFILQLQEPTQERMWFSLLMGFGKDIEVLEPDILKERMKTVARGLYDLYT
ncbi:helix-turn-helix transcriptional regulator [Anaerocolumna sp. MB42-C2]|uniref:helix-turn-helix transcriptional regulator n=1 Tax=Anaerocolumna sp. MB42-C2 TaxID=3070997 RepID=UPI0027DFB904|nr:YafY family protein [Anaerocolumna sp. MB42-C2]WMJ88358.1 YafY family protein [Anaerocolumna sp. MB42-C2]